MNYNHYSISQPLNNFFENTRQIVKPNHRELIEQFILKFLHTNLISQTAQYYNSNVIISISINKQNNLSEKQLHILYEFHEFHEYVNKLTTMGISSIHYTSGMVITQPLQQDKATVLVSGNCCINDINCIFIMNFVIDLNIYKITNYTVSIYY